MKIGRNPKGNSSSNHPFSSAMLVSGRVIKVKIKNQPNLAAHRQGSVVIGLHIGKWLGNPITLSMCKLSQVVFLSELFSRTDGKVLSGSWHIHDWVSLLVLGGSSHLVSKWLIAMVIVSPLSRATFPFQMA